MSLGSGSGLTPAVEDAGAEEAGSEEAGGSGAAASDVQPTAAVSRRSTAALRA
ncbi:hypothetical protein [Streptomyces althioticus]|uniref:hypothetical protein n=1 Tax=Streptomyces althioticus TaxID=83380 RepID=UPI00378D43A4